MQRMHVAQKVLLYNSYTVKHEESKAYHSPARLNVNQKVFKDSLAANRFTLSKPYQNLL